MSAHAPHAPRLLVVTTDVPLPADSGGRVDVWRRLQALHQAGWALGLLCWRDADRTGPGDAAADATLREVCETVAIRTISHRPGEVLHRLSHLARLPSHAASRWITLEHAASLAMARAFAPDAVLADGLYAGACARWLAQQLGVPLLYRAHNIEHLYMQRQWHLARRLRPRIGIALNRLGLARFERGLWRDAQAVLDISLDDLAQWRAQGFSRGHWLPTLVDESQAAALAAEAPARWDVAYFGNLHTPNNVDAVRWLVEAVWPTLAAQGLRLLVAGSRPSPEVRRLLTPLASATLVEDPPSMPEVVRQARVLVNPVQAGSGVNLKSVEMLFSRAGLVSTPVGVQGLPAAARDCFRVADSAPAFAQAVLDELHQPQATTTARETARADFTAAGAVRRLQAVWQAVMENRTAASSAFPPPA